MSVEAHASTMARRAGFACLVVLLLAAPVSARDDVPAEVSETVNPVAPLSERQVKYFAKHFRTKCARCHGPDGKGGGAEAAKQGVRPADLTDASYMATRSDGDLFYQLLKGGAPRCAMPAFGPGSDQGWSEEKLWGMVRWVRRLSAP